MNTKYAILITGFAAFTACSNVTSQNAASEPVAINSPRDAEMQKQQDGLSFGSAVVLEAKTQVEGVALQQAWIKKNLPGAHPASAPKVNPNDEIVSFGQELIQHNGKLYSVVHLEMADGKLRDVHFDITGYFGK
jgi:hypothetical protein